MHSDEDEPILDDLKDSLTPLVAGGFLTREELLDVAADFFLDSDVETLNGEDAQKTAARIIEAMLLAKGDEEKSWPAVTDCDRLTKAFEELTAGGIVALENAGYTISDGWSDFAEIVDGLWRPARREKEVRGGCFYHQQDLERAIDGGGLNIAFGCIKNDEAASIAIGQNVVEILAKHGFNPVWDGSSGQRILLPLKWQRRLAPRANVAPPV